MFTKFIFLTKKYYIFSFNILIKLNKKLLLYNFNNFNFNFRFINNLMNNFIYY